MRTITIGYDHHCRSLESLLRTLYPRATTAYLRQLAKGGKVAVNGSGAPVSLSLSLRSGDQVSIRESSRLQQLQDQESPVEILHEDDRILVLNKPAGLAVHRTAEDEVTLLDRARQYFTAAGVPVSPRPVNRLDRGTSGVVILAKGGMAAGMFGRMVKETGLSKLYLAIAEGELPPEGSIDLPIEGKESLTLFRCLYGGRGWSVVALWPMSGRMHQIRRHLSAAGAPVMGDRRYGSRTVLPGGAFCLHSFRTAFIHPETEQQMELAAPIPHSFAKQLERLDRERLPLFYDLITGLAPLAPESHLPQGELS